VGDLPRATNVVVSKSVDGAPVGPLGTSALIDLALALFAVPHGVMARPALQETVDPRITRSPASGTPSLRRRRRGPLPLRALVTPVMRR
jgi:hypothetical protein